MRTCSGLSESVEACSRVNKVYEAAPFSVRSNPDFRNSNGMEQNTVT